MAQFTVSLRLFSDRKRTGGIQRELSKKMLEHYSRERLNVKGQMLARMEQRRKKETA